ncbi:hypothetical protein NW766_001684 [Fusarium irregulare]|uniref:Uncharacterized protein n=1 Tax=Fusarium irregulare TaxID=2494466 RepID=A0A9W8PZB3_9HYPO|nr:hypothetical protein NW766_001684 [Fusarium irregulare]
MASSPFAHLSSSISGRDPPQRGPGNGQTNTGSTIYAQASQPPPSPNQPTEQSRQLAPAPCVGCTRRMAKVETNNREAMKKADACHFQSNLKSNKCKACRDRHRRCEWIEETEIQALASQVQSAFQRVKEKGHGSYSREEKELSRHALFKLQGKYPAAGGSKHR